MAPAHAEHQGIEKQQLLANNGEAPADSGSDEILGRFGTFPGDKPGLPPIYEVKLCLVHVQCRRNKPSLQTVPERCSIHVLHPANSPGIWLNSVTRETLRVRLSRHGDLRAFQKQGESGASTPMQSTKEISLPHAVSDTGVPRRSSDTEEPLLHSPNSWKKVELDSYRHAESADSFPSHKRTKIRKTSDSHLLLAAKAATFNHGHKQKRISFENLAKQKLKAMSLTRPRKSSSLEPVTELSSMEQHPSSPGSTRHSSLDIPRRQVSLNSPESFRASSRRSQEVKRSPSREMIIHNASR